MNLQKLLSLINSSESIEKFAEDNLLKICSKWNKHILNYDEIRLGTPAWWVSHYCRWLTVEWESKNYKIVAKAFDRFFNYWQDKEYLNHTIDFSKPFEVQFKYDGSLILEWLGWIQTRGSFCETEVSASFSGTYKDLFLGAERIPTELKHGQTAVWELCSPHNQVVERYDKTFAVLLGVVNTDGTEEKWVYGWLKYNVADIEWVLSLLDTLKPTQEGFVLAQWRDDLQKYIRIKCKTKTWVELSHMKDSISWGSLWNVVFAWEIEDVVSVFPYLEDKLMELQKIYKEAVSICEDKYEEVKHIESQKDFALAVRDFKYPAVMFSMRKWLDSKAIIQSILQKK